VGGPGFLARTMSTEWAWPVNACPFQAGIAVDLDVPAMFTSRAERRAWTSKAAEFGLYPYAALPQDHPNAGVFVYRPADVDDVDDLAELVRRLIYVCGLHVKESSDGDKRWGMAAGYLAFAGHLAPAGLRCAFSGYLADAAVQAGLPRPRVRAPETLLEGILEARIGFEAVAFYDRATG
jgi:hypothetical protein